MLLRIREERSNESKPELPGPGKLMQIGQIATHVQSGISPNTTTNRQNSLEPGKVLTLKNFQPTKQISSNVVTPKYLKFKSKDERSCPAENTTDKPNVSNPKITVKGQTQISA